MFKDIQNGFEKFFTKERVLVILVFLIFSWILFSYMGTKTYMYDGMNGGMSQNAVPMQSGMAAIQSAAPSSSSSGTPGFTGQNVASPSDLLPVDKNSQWSALNPNTMNQGNVMMPDLLQAGYHIGLDTIGQTLRNPNLQLRSDPVIQKTSVGPWNNSTIEADLGRVPLELGVGPQ